MSKTEMKLITHQSPKSRHWFIISKRHTDKMQIFHNTTRTKYERKDKNEIKHKSDKRQKYQNTNTTKYKLTKYTLDKMQSNKIWMQQNTNWTKYKMNKSMSSFFLIFEKERFLESNNILTVTSQHGAQVIYHRTFVQWLYMSKNDGMFYRRCDYFETMGLGDVFLSIQNLLFTSHKNSKVTNSCQLNRKQSITTDTFD